MASTAPLKGTGLLLLLLLELQPFLFVSGQSSTAQTSIAPTTPSSTSGSTTLSSATTQMSAVSPSSNPTTAALTVSSVSISTSTGMSTTTSTTSNSRSTMNTIASAMTGSMSTNSSLSSTMNWITSGSAASNSSFNKTTSMNNTMISCLTYSCNYSDCYSFSMNRTPVDCDLGYSFCQLKKIEGMQYTLGCTVSCSDVPACANNSQTNCNLGCCNSTDCLISILASMANTNSTTTMMPMTTTSPTTTKAQSTTTQPPTNGKKCHKFQCTTTDCYKNSNNTNSVAVMCLVNQHNCELKKTPGTTVTTWEAGCAVNCLAQPRCTATGTTACHQECCNATTTASCLKLDGSLNMPSSATRGPHFSFASVLCLVFFLLSHEFMV